MKNILKLTFLTAGLALSSALMAQESIKTDAASTADKLETPKTTTDTKQEPAKATKQEPVKATPAPADASKSESKSDSSSGTRMAISEQGVPKKNKRKSSNSGTAPAATPPKK